MKYFFLLLSILLFSCKSTNATNDIANCDENTVFKEKFFSNIKYVEENISVRQNEKFKESLKFLSKYVHVSFERMANYANTYPIGVFEEDKKGWLEWYEKNKCNNLQLRDTK
ncbi:MAG: hypothetical protein GKR88_19025 [Flavobacteriaceae bacterium]|nr:MAG: hypothetical protein GKR88_18955 [Flavobacteriaceae bacterium]QMU66159.1 MAG: hypothetical protein GKR88_19025 [Flavobacteriaceae bacterium]